MTISPGLQYEYLQAAHILLYKLKDFPGNSKDKEHLFAVTGKLATLIAVTRESAILA